VVLLEYVLLLLPVRRGQSLSLHISQELGYLFVPGIESLHGLLAARMGEYRKCGERAADTLALTPSLKALHCLTVYHKALSPAEYKRGV
jgi:hypothetical protein